MFECSLHCPSLSTKFDDVGVVDHQLLVRAHQLLTTKKLPMIENWLCCYGQVGLVHGGLAQCRFVSLIFSSFPSSDSRQRVATREKSHEPSPQCDCQDEDPMDVLFCLKDCEGWQTCLLECETPCDHQVGDLQLW